MASDVRDEKGRASGAVEAVMGALETLEKARWSEDPHRLDRISQVRRRQAYGYACRVIVEHAPALLSELRAAREKIERLEGAARRFRSVRTQEELAAVLDAYPDSEEFFAEFHGPHTEGGEE